MYFCVTTQEINMINKKHLAGLTARTLALLKDPHCPTHNCYFCRRKLPCVHYPHTNGLTWHMARYSNYVV